MISKKKIFFIGLDDDENIEYFTSRIKIKTVRAIISILRQYGELSLIQIARQITNEKNPRLANLYFTITTLVKIGIIKKEYKLKCEHYPINLYYYSLISDIFIILPYRDSKIEGEIQKKIMSSLIDDKLENETTNYEKTLQNLLDELQNKRQILSELENYINDSILLNKSKKKRRRRTDKINYETFKMKDRLGGQDEILNDVHKILKNVKRKNKVRKK